MDLAAAFALIVGIIVVLGAALAVVKTVRIVPQARARNVERLGRYRKTLEPGMNVIIPFIDRVKPLIDLREQVVSFLGQPVITEDNLVVKIDTVLFFQVTDPRAADYEIVNYIQAIEQLTATMLRSVIGSMDLEQSLTSRDKINTMLRGVLDDASGKWGIRVTRVEIKAIDPPVSVKEAMEKQMRAEREKRAAILNAEGIRQAQILTADGDKQGTILRAEGDKQSAILRAEGQAQAIGTVFEAIHDGDPDPKLLAYQYLQTLPQLAQGPGSTVWMIPSELTSALKTLSSAFGDQAGPAGGAAGVDSADSKSGRVGRPADGPVTQGGRPVAGPADNGRPAQVPARAGPAELLGQKGNAEVLGRAGAAEQARQAADAAGLPGLTSPAEVLAELGSVDAPALADPAEVIAQAGPASLPELTDPAEQPDLAVPADLTGRPTGPSRPT